MNKIVASYFRKRFRVSQDSEISTENNALSRDSAWPVRAPMAMALEPRFMFDAAGGTTGAQLAEQAAAESVTSKNNDQSENLAQAVSSGEDGSVRNEVVVIDSAIQDYQSILDGVDPSLDVIVLDPGADVHALATALSGYSSLDAVHLITHGETGALNFSGGALTLDNLEASQDALLTIGGALSSDGDLLLYGCNVGADGEGQDFIDALATATGADIAASDDATGSSALGGDWDLEVSSGSIETETALNEETAVYDGLLLTDTIENSYVNGQTNTTNVNGVWAQAFTATQTGTLTQIGLLFNSAPATSDITVKVYSGEAVSGTALATNTWARGDISQSLTGTEWRTLTLTNTAAITSGNTYTVVFEEGAAGEFDAYKSNQATETYANGRVYAGGAWTTGHDLYFQFQQTYTAGPTVTDGNISITSSGGGTGGAYKVGDVITASWNNTAGGDNNSGITGVTMDFSAFGGGAAVAASNSSDTWTASYTITAGSVDTTNLNVSVAATSGSGTTTTADTSNLTADNQAPTLTDGNISISGASGTGGAYKVGDTVTATWNNTAGGDNNSDTISSATVDFSAFGGGSSVSASNSSGTWTATYTITAGAIDATSRNVSFTATDNAGNATTTADTTNATVDSVAPTVTDGNISISGASGTGGAFKIGDTVTATWNNTAGGDNNSDTISGVTVDFSQFGGGAAVAASNSSGTWTATYTIVAGAVDTTSRNVSVTATDNAGNATTTADTTNATVDSVAPTLTDGNISISGASGTGGAYKVGDTVTATWNNTAGGDNNSDTISSVTVDFSAFGGGAAVAASNSSGTWTATYTITAGAIDATSRNVSITATDNAGNTTTTADSSNATVDSVAPTVTDGNISISGASGTSGAYKVGDTVTATWNNTAGGDNNSDTISGVTVNFSAFGGGAAVAASNSSGTWTATYTIAAGAIDTTNANVSVTATDNAGNTTTTADSTNATVDSVAPTATDGNISITSTGSGAGGAYVVGDTITVAWNNSAGGDNNSDTISGVTVNFSAFGGGAAVAATNSSGTWSASYTVVTGSTKGSNLNASVTATDNAGNTKTTADTSNLSIVNSAPVASGTYNFASINEDTTATGVTVTSIVAGLTTSDADSNTLGVAVTGTTGNGTWQFSHDTTNGTDGTWTSFASGSTPAAATSLLLAPAAYVRYVPDGQNAETATITVRGWDQSSGTASSGTTARYTDTSTNGNATPFSSGTATGSQTVTAVNDLPSAVSDSDNSSGAGSGNFTTSFSAGGSAVSVTDSDFVITDVDNANMASATVVLTNNSDAGESITISGTPSTSNGITITYTSATQISLSGSATKAAYQTVIESIVYQNTNAAGSTTTGNRTVTITVNDGTGNDASPPTSTISVVTAPIIDLDGTASGTGKTATFTEGGGAVSIVAADATLSDSDSTNLNQLVIQLTNAKTSDVIKVGTRANGATVNGITITENSSSQITLSGSATKANYLALMKEVTFNNTSTAPDTTSRTITFTGRDTSNNTGSAATATVSVSAVNDAPAFAGLDATPNPNENVAVALDSNATLSDAELDAGNNYNGATLTLSRNGGANANDTFANTGTLGTLTQGGNLTVGGTTIGTVTTNSGGTLLMTFNASATSALVDSALQQITYANASNIESGAIQIDYSFSDGTTISQGSGGAKTATGSVTVTVAAVNDAPTFSGLNATPSFTKGGSAVVLDANATLADAELDNANNYNGATLQIVRNGGASANDTFSGSGTLYGAADNATLTQGGVLKVGTTSIGTVTTNSNGTLLLTFNASATSALVDSAIQQIAYSATTGQAAGNVQLDWSFSDGTTVAQGSGGAKTATGSVTVTVANAAPVISNFGGDTGTGSPTDIIYIDTGTTALSVTDADSTNFNGGNVTVAAVGAAPAGLKFFVDGTNVTSSAGTNALSNGDTISVGGTNIGTVNNSNLGITFNANATAARVTTLMQNVGVQAGTAGSFQFDVTVSDAAGGETSSAARVTINASNPTTATNNNLNATQQAGAPPPSGGGDGGGDVVNDPIASIGGGDGGGDATLSGSDTTTPGGDGGGVNPGDPNADAGFTFGDGGNDPAAPASDNLVQNAVNGNGDAMSSFYGAGSVTTGGRGTGTDAANRAPSSNGAGGGAAAARGSMGAILGGIGGGLGGGLGGGAAAGGAPAGGAAGGGGLGGGAGAPGGGISGGAPSGGLGGGVPAGGAPGNSAPAVIPGGGAAAGGAPGTGAGTAGATGGAGGNAGGGEAAAGGATGAGGEQGGGGAGEGAAAGGEGTTAGGQGKEGQGQEGQAQEGQTQPQPDQQAEGQGGQQQGQGGEPGQAQGGQDNAGQGGEAQGQGGDGADGGQNPGQGGQGQGQDGAQEGAFFQPGGRTSFTDQLAAAAQTQQSSLDKLVEAMERLAS